MKEQIARVRGEIETTQAGQKTLASQIALATVQLKVSEGLSQPPPADRTGLVTELRNAGVAGINSAAHLTVGILTWLLTVAPSALLIAALLFFPARRLWKRYGR